jgi:hypothetical protein
MTFDELLLNEDLSWCAAVVDMDGDQHQDMIYGNLVYLGDGIGSFTYNVGNTEPFNGNGFGLFLPSDINGDSKTDFVCSENPSGVIGHFSNEFLNTNPIPTYEVLIHSYIDINENNVFDTGDEPMPYAPIDLNPGPTIYTTQNGSKTLILEEGNYSLTSTFVSEVWTIDNNSISIVIDASSPSRQDIWFAFHPLESVANIDVTASIASFTCSTHRLLDVVVSNHGNMQGFANVEVVLDPNVQFVSSIPDPDQINGNTLVWNQAELNFNAEHHFQILFQMPDFNFAGNLISFVSNVSLVDINSTVLDVDSFELSQILTCAYDPNDITEHNGWTEQCYFLNDDVLEFTIRFKNTGNGNAELVRIVNPLNELLDWATLTPIAASHEYEAVIDETGNAVFTFPNINLPFETADELASHGYVTYQIKSLNGLDPLTVINSNAEIFFDFNPAALTNTEVNTVFDCSLMAGSLPGPDEYCSGDILIWTNEVNYAQGYQWTVDGEVISETNELNLILETGNYGIQQLVANDLCVVGFNSDVVVNAVPDAPSIAQNGNIPTAEGNGTFVWYLNWNQIAGENGNQITISESGIYGVSVVVNDCNSALTSNSFQYTSIHEANRSAFSLYPNPANGFFIVNIARGNSAMDISLKNQLGQVVLMIAKAHPGENYCDTNNLPGGLYWIEVGGDNLKYR